MSTLTDTTLDVLGHLPPGSTVIIPDVSWESYERLLAELGERDGVRITYGHGTLSIMSPSAKHEKVKELVLRIADTIADELDCDLESFGSTTIKKQELGSGAEPDTCFYVQNASAIAGKDHLDLGADPPPDVVVEVDIAHTSTGKFAFYESLGVPEVWLLNGDTADSTTSRLKATWRRAPAGPFPF